MLNDNEDAAKGVINQRIPMRDIFGFIENCEKITYGIGNTLKLKRQNDSFAIHKSGAYEAPAEVNIISLSWCIPSLTLKLLNQIHFKRL